MEVTYDREHNIAYIRFREAAAGVETIRLSDEINVDLAPDGSLYGIELLNPNEQLTGLGGGGITLTDPTTGRRIEIPWPGAA